MKKFVIFLIILAFLSPTYAASVDYNEVLNEVLPPNLKKIKVYNYNELNIELYKKKYKSPEIVLESDLKFFKSKEGISVYEGELLKNGKTYVILACSEPEYIKSYIIILLKTNKTYKLVNYFEKDNYLSFIVSKKIKKGEIFIGYAPYTDWGSIIKYNGKEFVLFNNEN